MPSPPDVADSRRGAPALRVAFVEPYFGGSHRAFAEGYAAASRHDVSLFTHPASFWKWRMQGGFLTLAAAVEEAAASGGPFDVIVASSMLDLARFLGTARRAAAGARSVLYMHENQLTYPAGPRDDGDMTYAMTNWASMSAADLVVFNSEYHRAEWFSAVGGFLERLPDARHAHLVAGVRRRSEVLPLGVDLARLDAAAPERGERPLVLWNHRWEHDKGPERFAAAMRTAAASGLEFDVALAGEQFVSDPTGFAGLRAALGAGVVHYGTADEASYRRLLRSADVVVSTARQEFFGIAITEAVYAGAFPLLPRALVYPERIPRSHHAACLYAGHDDLVAKLAWACSHREEAAAIAASLRPVMARHDWSVVAPLLDDRLQALV